MASKEATSKLRAKPQTGFMAWENPVWEAGVSRLQLQDGTGLAATTWHHCAKALCYLCASFFFCSACTAMEGHPKWGMAFYLTRVVLLPLVGLYLFIRAGAAASKYLKAKRNGVPAGALLSPEDCDMLAIDPNMPVSWPLGKGSWLFKKRTMNFVRREDPLNNPKCYGIGGVKASASKNDPDAPKSYRPTLWKRFKDTPLGKVTPATERLPQPSPYPPTTSLALQRLAQSSVRLPPEKFFANNLMEEVDRLSEGRERTPQQLEATAKMKFYEMKIEGFIETWTENIRAWCVNMIFRPLYADICEVDEFFTREMPSAKEFTCAYSLGEASPVGAMGGTSSSSSGFGGFGGFGTTTTSSTGPKTKRQTLQEKVKDANFGVAARRIMQKRLEIEPYLRITSTEMMKQRNGRSLEPLIGRFYALQRIESFSQDPCLGRYQYDSGQDLTLYPSTHSIGRSPILWKESGLPNDSMFLLHSFCAYLDETIPPLQGHKFLKRHVLDADTWRGGQNGSANIDMSKVDAQAQVVIAHETVAGKPHFSIVDRGHKNKHGELEHTTIPTIQGRNTLFQALALMMHIYIDERSGSMDTMDICAPPLDFASLVSKTKFY